MFLAAAGRLGVNSSTIGQDNFMCTMGLLLGHYGWTGYSSEADYKLRDLISTYKQRLIAIINDSSENYGVVKDRRELDENHEQ